MVDPYVVFGYVVLGYLLSFTESYDVFFIRWKWNQDCYIVKMRKKKYFYSISTFDDNFYFECHRTISLKINFSSYFWKCIALTWLIFFYIMIQKVVNVVTFFCNELKWIFFSFIHSLESIIIMVIARLIFMKCTLMGWK